MAVAVAVASEVVIDFSERATVADAVASEVVTSGRFKSKNSSLDVAASVSLECAVVGAAVALAYRRVALSTAIVGVLAIVGD